MNKKQKIYLSGPITGVSDSEERFAIVQKELEDKGYIVFNPHEMGLELEKDTGRTLVYVDYMWACLRALSYCDAVQLIKGWENSDGSRMEILCANKSNIPIYDEQGRECKIDINLSSEIEYVKSEYRKILDEKLKAYNEKLGDFEDAENTLKFHIGEKLEDFIKIIKGDGMINVLFRLDKNTLIITIDETPAKRRTLQINLDNNTII